MTSAAAQIDWMVCAMCGQRFNPDEHGACSGCPLASGCQLVCCPTCGFEMVNPQRSTLARSALKISHALVTFGRTLHAERKQ